MSDPPLQSAAMLFLHAQTALHAGSGTGMGPVDLPVQRERHTQWPVVPASTLKGILRDVCRPPDRNGQDQEGWLAAFGPEPDKAAEHAGALSLTDARILAFPVRSLKGVFAWVTCPAVVGRLHRDLKLVGRPNGFDLPSGPGEDKALCHQCSPLLVDENKLILEEFEFKRTGHADETAKWVAEHALPDDDTFTSKRLESHFVVLHDDDFTHFVRHATEVVARVGLDCERKTVNTGALFYEEFLPPESLFYSVVLASASRRPRHDKSAPGILAYLRESLPSVLQIGGDQTIGKGLCAVRLDAGKDGEA